MVQTVLKLIPTVIAWTFILTNPNCCKTTNQQGHTSCVSFFFPNRKSILVRALHLAVGRLQLQAWRWRWSQAGCSCGENQVWYDSYDSRYLSMLPIVWQTICGFTINHTSLIHMERWKCQVDYPPWLNFWRPASFGWCWCYQNWWDKHTSFGTVHGAAGQLP